MKISVAIVTRNREVLLKKCLLSLTKQIIKPFEIVVVDNNSEDATKDIIASFKKKLPIRYFFEEKIGIPYARNSALRNAKGDILAFIDDDVTVPPNWVAEIIAAHRKYKAAIAIQGYVIHMPRSNMYTHIKDYYQNRWFKTRIEIPSDNYRVNLNGLTKKAYTIRSICTRNCSFKLNRLKRLPIQFNTHFLRGSDEDFGNRLWKVCKEIIFCPWILVYHWEIHSFFSFALLSQDFIRGRRIFLLDRKWKNSKVTLQEISINLFTLRNILGENKAKRGALIHYSFILYLHRVVYISGYFYEKYKKILLK